MVELVCARIDDAVHAHQVKVAPPKIMTLNKALSLVVNAQLLMAWTHAVLFMEDYSQQVLMVQPVHRLVIKTGRMPFRGEKNLLQLSSLLDPCSLPPYT